MGSALIKSTDVIKRVGAYVLTKDLGTGVMGESFQCYKVLQPKDSDYIVQDKPFCIKILGVEFAKNAAYRQLFTEEIEKALKVNHPGIARVRDYICEDDYLAAISDYIKGRPLNEKFPKGGMTLPKIFDILEPIGEGLDLYHRYGIVHGNIKPENIFVTREGHGVLLDMGICKDAPWMGLIDDCEFRSPEQISERKITWRHGDRYSFGLLTYRMLAGSMPWDAKVKEELIPRLKEEDKLLPLSTFVPRIDVELLAGVMEMVLADPNRRPPYCMDIVDSMMDAIAKTDQTSDVPELDPETMDRARREVSRLDSMLANIDKKIQQKKERIQKMKLKLDASILEVESKLKENLGPQISELNEKKKEISKLNQEKNKLWYRLATKFSPKGGPNKKDIFQEYTLRKNQLKMFKSEKFLNIKNTTVFILIILVLALMAIQPFTSLETKWTIFYIDAACCAVFLANFFYEMSCSDSKGWYIKTRWIDLLTSIPITPAMGEAVFVRGGRFIRILRVLRFVAILSMFREKVEAKNTELAKLKELYEKELADQKTEEERQVEKLTQSFNISRDKILAELEPLDEESHDLEEQLLELGEIHPKLLGFRAKKPFSRADVKVGKAKIEMVLLPRGNFLMGSVPEDEYGSPDDKPQHRVILKSPFWMGTVLVTQALYRAVTGMNPSRFKGPNHPVETVSWYDAVRFCNSLSRRDGLNVFYNIDNEDETNISINKGANGYRLPTEAEWEYAARSGTKNPFSGGEDPNFLAWYGTNSEGKTHQVADKEPNQWGIFDMSGNVWEWCWDWKGFYTQNTETDPDGPQDGSGRVFRGGSWIVNPARLSVTCRGFERPTNQLDGIGFRIARTAK